MVTATTTASPPVSSAASAPPPVTGLPGALDAVLFNTNSCLLVTDTDGRILYSHNGNVPFVPASAQKLIVAAAALDRLGPDYRFTTKVVASAPPVGGVVDDLWLVGGGDPLLASPEYAAYVSANPATAGYPVTPIQPLADGLVARGVQVVRNGVHGDDTRYEEVRYLPTWPTLNQGEFDIGPLGALEVDQGLDRFHPDIPTVDPTGHGAGVLARLLGLRGVTAAQGVNEKASSRAVVLASVQSAPLAQIIEAMLRASDNQIAELLVREIDRQAGGEGTTAGGIRLVMDDATRLGIPGAGLALVDGSGLSHTNQATCDTLLAALRLGDQPRFTAIARGLPVAGVSGTFRGLFVNTPLAGHLAAKGGYIAGVASLVGNVDLAHPRRFALEVNGSFSFTVGLGLVERVAETVGTQ
jgi:D-alanyl-D-alanine carboxypeptidase/D-alanyl-D-alanine-endopeptidase (penicillin-binding protein 4)